MPGHKDPQPDGSVIYQLAAPIQVAGEKIAAFTFRKPLGRDMRELPAGDLKDWNFGVLLDFAGNLAGHPPSTMGLLEAPDVMEVLAIAGGFIGAGRETSASA